MVGCFGGCWVQCWLGFGYGIESVVVVWVVREKSSREGERSFEKRKPLKLKPNQRAKSNSIESLNRVYESWTRQSLPLINYPTRLHSTLLLGLFAMFVRSNFHNIHALDAIHDTVPSNAISLIVFNVLSPSCEKM